jgi:hypothetical protein
MGYLKKIRYNCKQATFLIEKKLISRLTLSEAIKLQIHLMGCLACQLYQKQSRKINDLIYQLFHSSMNQNIMLDDNFKNELQERIEIEMKKIGKSL